ncbi:MAG: DoxX family protein [Candidatus Dormibacteria bacterium]
MLRHLRLFAMIGLIGGSGVLHFVAPEGYRRIVPRVIGHPNELVALSGGAELLCAALMAVPRTRRAGGFLTLALLVAVFPANVQMALDGGVRGAPFPLNSALGVWLRLPLQAPLIWAAWLIAQQGRDSSAAKVNSRRSLPISHQ